MVYTRTDDPGCKYDETKCLYFDWHDPTFRFLISRSKRNNVLMCVFIEPFY